jgi:hypothetical protein
MKFGLFWFTCNFCFIPNVHVFGLFLSNDASHTQNFEIVKPLEKTQESKEIKDIYAIFVKKARWLKF